MSEFIKKELEDYRVLLKSVPAPALTLFVVSVIAMNLLANKELFTLPWIALDCGFVLSWISFLAMDCICRRFGGKASTKIAIIAILINLAVCGIFKLMSLTPGMWGEYYSTGSVLVNDSLNATIGGSWHIVLGSALAMSIASVINSLIHVSVARLIPGDGYKAFAACSFISTGIAQFADNFVFSLVVSIPLFGWSLKQAVFCSLTGALLELLMEIAFSGFGYRISRQWKNEDAGKEYLEFRKGRRQSR